MTKSREIILNNLRSKSHPFNYEAILEARLPVSAQQGNTNKALEARFISELSALGVHIYQPKNDHSAAQIILDIIGGDQKILTWDMYHIPIKDIDKKLESANVYIAPFKDPDVRVSISGVDTALAATGSLVLSSGPGKYRSASILSRVHIAVLNKNQIVADLETWVVKQRDSGLEAFRKTSNTIIITGASRTADITGEVILGMHGPEELHVVLMC